MADFRRWITALAVIALFVGLASAQVVGGAGQTGGPLACTATVTVPPQLRSEGMTELLGDIVITCTGGQAPANGAAIPTANITVSLGTNVTSRLLNTTSANVSEALLLIDEPGSGLTGPGGSGFGPQAAQTLCSTATLGAGPGGCTSFVQTVNGVPVMSTSTTTATGNAPNVFQGIVNANQVTFLGIPILAPVSTGVSRVFRITNVRANISGLGGSGLIGTTQVLASISISGSTSLPINNPVQIAGFAQPGLSVAARNANNTGGLSGGGASFNQCGPGSSSGGPMNVSVLQYNENFGTAFKTRVQATSTYNGQAGPGTSFTQNVPGTIYNSESGFIYPGASGGGFIAGLADYGTRLKATFNNVPAGMRIFVSVTNLAANLSSNNTVAPAATSTSSYAILVNGEASPDTNGFPPALSPTTTLGSGAGVFEITPSGGAVAGQSYQAVWEVINTNPNALETFNFGVFTQFSANPGSNSPPPGTGTVSMSFAPTPPGPFSVSAGGSASATLTIPRFADLSTARNVIAINICQTALLYPYVTNQAGFDTGLSIANTSTDPFGTGTQAGTCRLNWYGSVSSGTLAAATGINVADVTKETAVASGTVAANLASALNPNFQGYVIAVCNFQWAHGFAFISDLGARNLAMGYLALVVNNGTLSRGPSAESLGN